MYDEGEAGADIEDPYYNEYDVDQVDNWQKILHHYLTLIQNLANTWNLIDQNCSQPFVWAQNSLTSKSSIMWTYAVDFHC